MYIEMNPVMQLYNTFRNRWVGAYLASKGITVIPTVNWGLENTFDFCFNGIEKGSIVAVSTYMYHEHGNHSDQKDLFMKGYNEMLRRIEPELVICYSEPFPEMQGNILYIDYDLSSWQHYEDDECKSFYPSERIFKYHSGRVMFEWEEKGGGSASGGKWIPKKEAHKRLVGTPNTINTYIFENGDVYLTKIGDDGYAILERHCTTHNREHTGHTNPHDHIIDWSNGYPTWILLANYPDGNAPEFKHYERTDKMHYFANSAELQFESISDFKWCMRCGGEVEFTWNDKSYGIGHEQDGKMVFYEANNAASEIFCNSSDEILNIMLGKFRLREIITEINVIARSI